MKYDGYRLLVAVGGGELCAYTRSGLDRTEKFAGIVAAAALLNVKSALIDGESVVLDLNRKSSFEASRGP
jgi:bifunctional non-homologous end joining protein LigD